MTPYQAAEANHEDQLGPTIDILPAGQSVEGAVQGLALSERLRAWGFDPAERRIVDYDGAEGQLHAIAHPERAYYTPALLLVLDAKRIEISYPGTDSRECWEGSGQIAIFREPSGSFRIQSPDNSEIAHEVSAHLDSSVSVNVWTHEVSLQCRKRGEIVLEITIDREPTGLFAYSHPA